MDTTQALTYRNGADLVRALTDRARKQFLADAVTATLQRSAADLLPRLGDALAEASDLVAPADDARDAAQAECDRLDARLGELRRDESMAGRESDKATIRQAIVAVAEAQVGAGRALAAAAAEAQAARDAARSIAAKVDVIAKVAEPDAGTETGR